VSLSVINVCINFARIIRRLSNVKIVPGFATS